MKTGDKTNIEGKGILDAVLTDEHWQTMSGELRHQALGALRQARRRRQVRAQIGQTIFAVALLGSTAWWFHSPISKTTLNENAAIEPQLAVAKTSSRYISEEEMLAMFPRGSCVVAEVDGHKELVFFDAEAARKGFIPRFAGQGNGVESLR
jgi:hypothetical protein